MDIVIFHFVALIFLCIMLVVRNYYFYFVAVSKTSGSIVA